MGMVEVDQLVVALKDINRSPHDSQIYAKVIALHPYLDSLPRDTLIRHKDYISREWVEFYDRVSQLSWFSEAFPGKIWIEQFNKAVRARPVYPRFFIEIILASCLMVALLLAAIMHKGKGFNQSQFIIPFYLLFNWSVLGFFCPSLIHYPKKLTKWTMNKLRRAIK